MEFLLLSVAAGLAVGLAVACCGEARKARYERLKSERWWRDYHARRRAG